MVEQVQRVRRELSDGSPAAVNSLYHILPQPSRISPPKIDATNRNQIEAQNEDKSHTTKEALDDIKRVHRKEKKKKEQTNIDKYGLDSEGQVGTLLIRGDIQILQTSKNVISKLIGIRLIQFQINIFYKFKDTMVARPVTDDSYAWDPKVSKIINSMCI